MRTERGCVAETNRAPGQGQDAPRMEKRLEKNWASGSGDVKIRQMNKAKSDSLEPVR